MNILLVDDDDDALTSLLLALRSKGYELFTSRNGIEALEVLNNKPVDLVITDILMPAMDGFELCRQMKSDTSLHEIPLIFHTATYIDKRDKTLAAELGAAEYLLKPAEPEVLYKTIEDALAAVPQLPVIPMQDQAGIIEQHRNVIAFKLDQKVKELEIEKKALRTQM
ncbi:MAG: response regulator [Gammaproteobacteria bacterium]|nr:response regulator [Gammaproteobacteria bacterium]